MSFIKKYKWVIAGAAVIVAVLIAAFFCGGSLSPKDSGNQSGESVTAAVQESYPASSSAATQAVSGSAAPSQPSTAQTSAYAVTTAPPQTSAAQTTEPYSGDKPETSPPQTSAAVPGSSASKSYSSKSGTTLPPTTSQPKPVEPETKVITDKKGKCTMTISCSSLLSHIDGLDDDTAAVVPQDGLILPETEESFNEGENVFDVLKRVCKSRNIHMEYTSTPVYNSAYIEGIGNLYEFDCGSGSGWMYRVNGAFPNYGCSRCAVKDGDRIEWLYTCDLGRDIGGYGIQYSD